MDSPLNLLHQNLTDEEKLANARALLNIKPMAGEVVSTAQTRLLVAEWLMAEVQLSKITTLWHPIGIDPERLEGYVVKRANETPQ